MKSISLASLAGTLVVSLLAVSGCGGSGSTATSPQSNGDASGPTAPLGSGASDKAGSNATAKKKKSKDRSNDPGTSSQKQPSSAYTGFKPEPAPVQLYRSSTSGVRVGKPTVVAIRSQAELDSWTKREANGNPQGAPSIEVKFKDNRQVWAVFLPKSPAGARLAVSSVRYNGNIPRVFATMSVPGKGCKTYGGATYPTAWVETRELSGTPELRVTTLRTTC